MIRRQILIVCTGSGDVIADVMLDSRSMTRAELDRHVGWTYCNRELRGSLADAARWEPPGSPPVIAVELIHHPERVRFDGRRTRRAVTYCRVLFTIPVQSAVDAA